MQKVLLGAFSAACVFLLLAQHNISRAVTWWASNYLNCSSYVFLWFIVLYQWLTWFIMRFPACENMNLNYVAPVQLFLFSHEAPVDIDVVHHKNLPLKLSPNNNNMIRHFRLALSRLTTCYLLHLSLFWCTLIFKNWNQMFSFNGLLLVCQFQNLYQFHTCTTYTHKEYGIIVIPAILCLGGKKNNNMTVPPLIQEDPRHLAEATKSKNWAISGASFLAQGQSWKHKIPTHSLDSRKTVTTWVEE